MYLPGESKGLSRSSNAVLRGGDTGLSCDRSPYGLENCRRLIEALDLDAVLTLLPFPTTGVTGTGEFLSFSPCCELGDRPLWLEMFPSTLRGVLVIGISIMDGDGEVGEPTRPCPKTRLQTL